MPPRQMELGCIPIGTSKRPGGQSRGDPKQSVFPDDLPREGAEFLIELVVLSARHEKLRSFYMGVKKSGKHRISSVVQGSNRPMKDGENYPYAIIRHNTRTLENSLEVAVVMGETRAARAVQYHNMKLTAEQRDAGWSHYSTRTTKRPQNEILESRSNNKPGILRKRAR